MSKEGSSSFHTKAAELANEFGREGAAGLPVLVFGGRECLVS